MKKLLRFIPEFFFILCGATCIIGDYLALGIINIAILFFILVLLLQLVFQKRVIGLLLGSVFGLISLSMMFAVLSEFYEFKTLSAEAFQLLAFGLGIFGVSFLMGFAMIYKSAIKKVNSNPNRMAL